MTRILMMLLCVALLAVAGCKGDKKQEAPAPAPAAEPAGEPVGEAASEVPDTELDELDVKTGEEPETKVADEELPTPADFEEEAAEKITAANMESELDALDEELMGD